MFLGSVVVIVNEVDKGVIGFKEMMFGFKSNKSSVR